MIQTNELRIGNLVYKCYPDGNEIAEVKNISASFINSLGISAIEPIPLTEEILLRLGFEKDMEEFRLPKIHGDSYGLPFSTYEFLVRLYDGYFDVVLGEDASDNEVHAIIIPSKNNQVHKLQNLYYSIFGKELTIKY